MTTGTLTGKFVEGRTDISEQEGMRVHRAKKHRVCRYEPHHLSPVGAALGPAAAPQQRSDSLCQNGEPIS